MIYMKVSGRVGITVRGWTTVSLPTIHVRRTQTIKMSTIFCIIYIVLKKHLQQGQNNYDIISYPPLLFILSQWLRTKSLTDSMEWVNRGTCCLDWIKDDKTVGLSHSTGVRRKRTHTLLGKSREVLGVMVYHLFCSGSTCVSYYSL